MSEVKLPYFHRKSRMYEVNLRLADVHKIDNNIRTIEDLEKKVGAVQSIHLIDILFILREIKSKAVEVYK